MIRTGVVGLGKMGLSHVSMLNAHPDVDLVGICDSSGMMLSVLGKYTGMTTYTDLGEMLDRAELDALLVATPSRLHAPMVRTALERGLHVFCEKPFCLDPTESAALTALARERSLVTQVGYHYRHVGAFAEVKRLLDAGAIGTVTHVLAEAYGPVVLKPQGGTWRSQRSEGGGSLYDYAAHPLNLLNWYLGEPTEARGTVLGTVFSRETDDTVLTTLRHGDDGPTAQLSVDWSDESQRKMTTKVTVWGTRGRIFADRQECQVYLRDTATPPEGYETGWNVRYTTDLTEPVWFYVRGEEYSAQLDHFVRACASGDQDGINSFAESTVTDRTMALMLDDARDPRAPSATSTPTGKSRRTRRRRWWRR